MGRDPSGCCPFPVLPLAETSATVIPYIVSLNTQNMPRCDKLESRARQAPASIRFADLCRLAECWGYEFVSQRGSHVKYKHARLRLPAAHAMQTFQEREGKGVAYQVRQLLDGIDYIREHFPEYES